MSELTLVLAALLAVACVVYVARPFLADPDADDERLDGGQAPERPLVLGRVELEAGPARGRASPRNACTRPPRF